MTMPTPERIGKYAERLVSAARDMVAEPNDMKPRETYLRAAFNLDWTAAAIVALADERDSQRTALREAEARAETVEGERDEAQREAVNLACWMHKRFYSEVTQWRPFNEPASVVSQIDNMLAGIVQRLEAAEARATTAETALAQAREALEIFATYADLAPKDADDECVVRLFYDDPDPEIGGPDTLLGELFLRAFRAAQSALRTPEQKEEADG